MTKDEEFEYIRLHERHRVFREAIIAAIKTPSSLKNPVVQYGRDAIKAFDELFPEKAK